MTTKYIYSMKDCPKCEALKRKYEVAGIAYIERSGDRLKVPAEDRDSIDGEAHVQLNMQNMVFPVMINI